MKKKVLIRAPLLTVSGYGEHSRQIFRWAISRKDFDVKVQILNWGNTTWMINPDLEGGLIGEIMSRSLSEEDEGTFDLSVQVQLPDEWDKNIAKVNVGVSAFVETDRCPQRWIECCNDMDSVIVPSEHVKQTILRTGLPKTSIYVVSETFPDVMLNESISPLDISVDTDFNFLIVGQFTGGDSLSDRKNLFFTLKWICEEFAGDKDVGIILKANQGRGTRIDRKLTHNTVNKILSEVRIGEFPKVHIVHGIMSSDEMASLYHHPTVKCFVSATRGEGFGLPLLESAVSGIPVIATNWSGHLDFLRLGKFIPVNYTLTDIPSSRVDDRIFEKGFKWADPIESDFKKKIKKFRHNSEKPKQWARELSDTLKSRLCQEEINKDYSKVIHEACGV